MTDIPRELEQVAKRAGISLEYNSGLGELAGGIPGDESPLWAAQWGALLNNYAVLTERRLLIKTGAAPAWSVPYTQIADVEVQQLFLGWSLTLTIEDDTGDPRVGVRPRQVLVKGLNFPTPADAEQLRGTIVGARARHSKTASSAGKRTTPAGEKAGTGATEGPPAAPDRQTLLIAVGSLAFDADGAKVGTVAQAFQDEDSGQVRWVGVRTGFFHGTRIAPVAGAFPVAGGLRLSVSRQQLTTAPGLAAPDRYSDEEELRLLRHYGLAAAEAQDTSAPVRGQDGAGQAPATEQAEAGPTTFEVHILGPSGSGKTVYLASLHQRMRLRRPRLCFYLKSDHASSTYLNAVYNRVTDLEAGWPESSQGVQEWNFTTVVQSAFDDFEPLRFRYVDYPGGILTNPRAAQDPSIQALVGRLRAASALLVLLDGQAMAALLEGNPRGQRYLSFDLTSSLEIAQQSRCPLHFVVTKWDLLEGRYTLAELRDRLLADDNFADLVQAKIEDTNATIRLFPVSAVGPAFADPDPSGGMLKTGGALRPQNVELPLISVLPDFLQYAYTEILARAAAADAASAPAAETPNPAGKGLLRTLSGTALRASLVQQYPVLGLIPPKVFEDALGYGERMFKARQARTGRGAAQAGIDLMAARRDVNSDRAALDLLERQCEQLISQFEESDPASVLGGGMREFMLTGGAPPPTDQA